MMVVAVFVCSQLIAGNSVKGRLIRSNKLTAAQRRSGSNGYVDFGAHTGPQGSYGWYADFPANKN